MDSKYLAYLWLMPMYLGGYTYFRFILSLIMFV